MTPISAAILILILPLLAFVIQMFFGRRLPDHGWYVPTAAILIDLSLALWLFFVHMMSAADPGWHVGLKWEFIRIGDFHLPLGLHLDNISVVMLIVVTLVSGLVHIFSTGYMAEDPRKSRFFGYLGLFSFSMLWLVLSDNLLGIFIGWELVGLSSYLLIGFWFELPAPPAAAMKAFVANRIGDLGFLGALMILMAQFGTLDLVGLQQIVADLGSGALSADLSLWMTLAGIGLFCGAVGKSAQFPLHVWLPDAMEGPTPVSALIHAATMVAAGVYLLIRIFFILTFDASLVVAYVGGFTALMAATIAVAQWDIKKVLAYSTISQLGYMVMAVGVGAYSAGFLHLMTHAFFKACLFLGSGSVIHAMHHVYHKVHDHDRDAQDMRNMGGLRRFMPRTYATFLLATLALTGVPLTSGFISKDAILAGSLAFGMEHPQHATLAFFGFAAAALTAFYMFRLVFLTFHGSYQGRAGEEQHLHENKLNITGPLLVLSALSLFFFYSPNPTDAGKGWFYRLIPAPAQPLQHIGKPVSDGAHVDFLSPVTAAYAAEGHGETRSHAATATADNEHLEHIKHTAHLRAMAISVVIVALSILAAWLTYMRHAISAERVAGAVPGLYRFLQGKWFFDELYQATFIRLALWIAGACRWFDRCIVDGLVNAAATIIRIKSIIVGGIDRWFVDGTVNGVGWVTRTAGAGVRVVQGGDIQGYLVGALAGVVALLIWQVL
jgi:NADH-quinone oxidoreductase subunit L